MSEAAFGQRWRRALRRREHLAVALYLLAVGAVSAWALSPSLRTPVLDRAEAVVRYWDDRWTRRLERAETWVAAKRYAEALPYLQALDEDFPAPTVKYARDRERERLLEAIGASEAGLGRDRRSLEVFRRLAAFDPLNFRNHFLFARQALVVGEDVEALASFERVLEIHPTHLESVRSVILHHFERGDFRAVVAAYERYLDAFELARVAISVGSASAEVRMLVDGRRHPGEVRLARSAGTGELLRVQTVAREFELASLWVETPQQVGQVAQFANGRWRGDPQRGWLSGGLGGEAGNSRWVVSAGDSLELPLPDSPQGPARISLELRIFKPVDDALWSAVARSYRNLVDWDGLRRARARTHPEEPSP